MFDISIEFEKLLKKYNDFINIDINKNYIYECIVDIIEKIPKNYKVSIRGGGDHTFKLMKLIEGKIKIDYIFDSDLILWRQKYKNVRPVSDIPLLDIDVIIISSYSFKEEMKKELSQLDKKYIIIDIYEELKNYGIYLDNIFYESERYLHYGISNLISKYNLEKDISSKEKILKNIISKFIYIKDFININKFIDKYIECKYSNFQIYKNIKNDINNLLNNIENEFSKRKQKDIIVIWNDSLPFERLEETQYLKKISKDSVFFENAYTTVPYTYPVFCAIFSKKYHFEYLDNQEKLKTGCVIKYIQDNGYNFQYIGIKGIMFEGFAEKFDTFTLNETYNPSSLRYWEMLRRILLSDKKVFAIMHGVTETHYPYLNPISENLNIKVKRFSEKWKTPELIKQMNESLKYWDSQIEFYDSFLNYDCTKIFMSDHGNWLTLDDRRYFDDSLHVLFFIKDKDLKNQICSELFSLYNFDKVITYLIKKDEDSFNEIFSDEFMKIGDEGIFNTEFIKILEKLNAPEDLKQKYQGLKSKNDKYVKIFNGQEFYFINSDEKNNLINDEKYKERIEQLRKLNSPCYWEIQEKEI